MVTELQDEQIDMKRPMVSIIVPVYNVEKYVSRAIESILAQTWTDWELWLVDDGSTDKSGQICDKYAKGDNRIHVVHKENGGAPSARNVAMEKALGKYYYFMDADDWAEMDMLSEMVQQIECTKAQLLICSYYIDTYYSETEFVTEVKRSDSYMFMEKQEFREHAYTLFDRNLLYTPWNKLYLAEYLKEEKIFFPKTFWDDFPFNLAVIKNIEKVCVYDKPFYHFIRKREDSESSKYNPTLYEKREEEHQWLLDLFEMWKVDNPETIEFVSRRYVERIVGCIENVANKKCTLDCKQKMDVISEMIKSKKCRQAIACARPNSLMMKLLIWPIKMKNARLAYYEGKFISKIKKSNIRMFAVLKAKR